MKNKHSWIAAWVDAVASTWPDGVEKPHDVDGLMSIAKNLPFVAPEIRGAHAREAWEVYESTSDPVVARVAVGLTYAICSTVPATPSR